MFDTRGPIRTPQRWIRAGFIAYFIPVTLGALSAVAYRLLAPSLAGDAANLWLICPGLGILIGVFAVVAVSIASYLAGTLVYRFTHKDRRATLAGAISGFLLSLPLLYATLRAILAP